MPVDFFFFLSFAIAMHFTDVFGAKDKYRRQKAIKLLNLSLFTGSLRLNFFQMLCFLRAIDMIT